ncbi:HAD-IIIC family phosphatase [Actinokineospora auranticolor]|uniref:HAD superfamily phosphatase (TIGR01681 family)/FkbH-like protein n=1 Tax=Actinokineospora auranticolor TaxID=155976 RepID=A0A2S6H1R3_9PSEU|nr:HAD-IIIC family phosphatase [Actinokineospora auranticolor]PPK71412.1 HAD superfamily phosphatase (TIGR01681 family)/FkbH-like protein [Actinokineospora auranticolor]
MTTEDIHRAPVRTALDELRALHHDGLLATHYDRVPALLADPADRAAAGRLLARVDPDEVAALHSGLPTASVAITGSGTLNALGTALTAELARHGYLPRVRVADFNTYAFDLDDPSSDLYANPADVTIAVLDHTAVFGEVPSPFTVADVETALAAKIAHWTRLASRFADHGTGTLVLNTVPLPREWVGRIIDHPGRARLSAAWRRANADLLDLGSAPGPVTVLDLDPLVDGVPLADPRFATYAHAHLSDELLGRYARDVAHLVRARTGRLRKVLALDLDNTLWGGVLGDDGVEGIEVAHTPRGEAFQAVQRLARQLQSQGVLLAAVSKNDADTVAAALRDHPDLGVPADAFVRVIANWQPKPDNLRRLARELNVGIDTVVFVDDSAHEIAAVRAELPTTTVHVAGDPAEHTPTILADDWFATTEITDEDRHRTRLYHEEAAREEFLSASDSIGEFLADLGISVRLAPATPAEIARVAQLTLRTNQFNLTTIRLQQDDVVALTKDPAARVLTITTADRFGGNGIVGVLVLRAAGAELRLENFLLSCRVFARGIEQAVLSLVLTAAREGGFVAVTGEFRPTAKNGKVAELLPHFGFETLAEGTFRHDLGEIVTIPEHLVLDVAEKIVPDRP